MEHHTTYCHPFILGRRRFLTEEEKKEIKELHKKKKIQWMERYKESLEKELKGVNERLEEFKK